MFRLATAATAIVFCVANARADVNIGTGGTGRAASVSSGAGHPGQPLLGSTGPLTGAHSGGMATALSDITGGTGRRTDEGSSSRGVGRALVGGVGGSTDSATGGKATNKPTNAGVGATAAVPGGRGL